jgi:putative protease
MVFNNKPEILAPAGTLDAVRMVIDAGADAVYVGGKSLNMRQHRTSYNLTESEIAQAIELAHQRGRKLYFTLNSLVLDPQIPQVRGILAMLNRFGPDAIIVQDLGVASLAREICVQIPLHASTMMNVHNVETAVALKMMGFARIIPSRDVPLHEIRRIHEQSGLQMECFVHGDMCISQSSLCYISAILFGESSNCGRCMKPCRWKWRLIARRPNAELPEHAEGYLLARKDICLFGHIPALVQNGIAALKIEGRMRTAEFIAPVVAMYRKAVDRYFEDPVSYVTNAAEMQSLFEQRVRELTTAHTFSNPGCEGVDVSGKREPRFFSYTSPEPQLTAGDDVNLQPGGTNLELIVHVSSAKGAEAALQAGADAVYFCGEGFALHGAIPTTQQLAEFARRAHGGQAQPASRCRVGVMMPHVCDQRDMGEWQERLRQFAELPNITIGVSNLGGLQMARENRCRDILADYTLNTINSVAADELSTMGAARVTASVELGFKQLASFSQAVRMPVEVIGQGPICGMLMEHCVIASVAGENPQGVCSMRCRLGAYALEDAASQVYSLEYDRRCRNHLFTATDVCVLPNLSRIASLGISGLRIEGQLDQAETIATVTRIYRESIERLRAGEPIAVADALSQITAATGRPLSDGPFDFRSVGPPPPANKEMNLARAAIHRS